jgi:hypothetical protein
MTDECNAEGLGRNAPIAQGPDPPTPHCKGNRTAPPLLSIP